MGKRWTLVAWGLLGFGCIGNGAAIAASVVDGSFGWHAGEALLWVVFGPSWWLAA